MATDKIDDGGPAFPVDFDHHVFQPGAVAEARRLMAGMSLRDYFAAKAMQGDMAAQNEATGEVSNTVSDEHLEERCRLYYRIADAMLKASK